MYEGAVQDLIDELGRLPGVGPKSAQRIAFHLLNSDSVDVERLASTLVRVKNEVQFCTICGNVSEAEQCRICTDVRRDQSVICVVEEPGDVIPIERTHEYDGVYHVLGGALSPIEGIDAEDLKIAELLARVAAANGGSPAVREVVLATNPTTTGEATALYIADELHGRSPGLTVTRLASGLPVGSDLEYADEVTLGKAFAGRRAV